MLLGGVRGFNALIKMAKNKQLSRGREEQKMSVASTAGAGVQASVATRWMQLISVVICMVMIANLQYGWTLFVNPMNKTMGWSKEAIQFGYAVFIALETWLTPIDGWIVDSLGPKRGPKLMVALGGLLVGLGWVINSVADSLTLLYVGCSVAGIGGGAIYATEQPT
jgi:MFS transporter, OFA family, oxalate/formate antiporter